jgi:hypothetical protein
MASSVLAAGLGPSFYSFRENRFLRVNARRFTALVTGKHTGEYYVCDTYVRVLLNNFSGIIGYIYPISICVSPRIYFLQMLAEENIPFFLNRDIFSYPDINPLLSR